MVVGTAFMFLALAALSPYIYERVLFVHHMFYLNAPARMPRIHAFKTKEIKFADKIRNCEDALLIESKGVAILGCDPGRDRWNTVLGNIVSGPVPGAETYLYDYTNQAKPESKALTRLKFIGLEDEAGLHTLGLAYNEKTSLLLLTNHHREGMRIEVFRLNIGAATATHIRTLRHPLLNTPNSLTWLGDNEFYVTNDHQWLMSQNRVLSLIETYLSLPLGTVVHVDISDPIDVKANLMAKVPYANGVSVLNETTVAVAATSRGSIYLFAKDPSSSPPKLEYKSQIKLPFMVDNLHLTSDGTLMMAGHPHPSSVFEMGKTRAVCNSPDELAEADASVREKCETIKAGSWVSEWAETRGLKNLYVDLDYPTSCTAAFDASRKMGIVTGLYAKGILVYTL